MWRYNINRMFSQILKWFLYCGDRSQHFDVPSHIVDIWNGWNSGPKIETRVCIWLLFPQAFQASFTWQQREIGFIDRASCCLCLACIHFFKGRMLRGNTERLGQPSTTLNPFCRVFSCSNSKFVITLRQEQQDSNHTDVLYFACGNGCAEECFYFYHLRK